MSTPTNSPDAPAVEARSGVLVLTTDDESSSLAAARAAAAEIAARSGVPLTLYDRSQETWGDTQHPRGPLSATDDSLGEASHLIGQLESLQSSFEVKAQAWIATLPSISSLGTAIPELGSDVVVVPGDMSRKLLETTLPGDSLAGAVREYLDGESHLDVTVVEVDNDGAVSSVLST